jgi:SHS2 domain-containing protein
MPAPDFREIDWSGDVAVEAWGATRAAMLENATRGLFALMTWDAVEPAVQRRVEAAAPDAGALLVEWLCEVIRLAATHGEVYGGVRVEQADAESARGVLHGAAVDADRHQLRCDVKAATYHGLLVEETGDGFHCRVVFDL